MPALWSNLLLAAAFLATGAEVPTAGTFEATGSPWLGSPPTATMPPDHSVSPASPPLAPGSPDSPQLRQPGWQTGTAGTPPEKFEPQDAEQMPSLRHPGQVQLGPPISNTPAPDEQKPTTYPTATVHEHRLLNRVIPTAALVEEENSTPAGDGSGANSPASALPLVGAPLDPPADAAPAEEPLPLAPRGQQGSNDPLHPGTPVGPSGTIYTVISSLALVLGLFLLLAWMMRRGNRHAIQALPGEAVQVLGRAPLAGRQQMHLVRVGGKLLLVSVTPTGAETLTEITDPAEVDRLAGMCQKSRPDSVSATFRQIFDQLGNRPARGFIESPPEQRHG